MKLVILLEYQNIKTFLQKALIRIGLKKFFLIKNVKNTVLQTHVISDLKDKKVVEIFYKKELQKTNQKKFKVEKVRKRNGHKP